MISPSPIVLLLVCFHVLMCDSQRCINTYQDLKASVRSNFTDNIHRMMRVFYPPNKSTNHAIFIHYCVQDEDQDEFDQNDFVTDAPRCNYTFARYQFQWLMNSLPLLIDSDVLKANTFDFASLNSANLSLNIDPFCGDVDGLEMLETLTVWVNYST